MGGRIVELLNSPHRGCQALMPWLLNGTLTPAERCKLDAHLRECASCRAELEAQRRITALYREATAAPSGADGSAALGRLALRLDAEAAPAPRRATPRFGWRLVAVLQFGVIAALAWTVWLLRPAVEPADAPAMYRGLAAAPSHAGGDAIVFFAADASEIDVRRTLRRAGARIVDGPSAAGAYLLRFEQGTAGAALAALRSERIVVRVESLASVGGPSPAPRN